MTVPAWFPWLLALSIFGLIAAEVISAVRTSRRPAAPEDGCCGCGADTCDAIVAPVKGRGEGYCWTCLDAWPADAEPLVTLGFTVLPGRERSAR